MNFRLLKEIDIASFDTSGSDPTYLMSYRARNFEINASMANLVKVLKNSHTIDEAASKFSALANREYTENDIEALYGRFISPIFSEEVEDQKKKDMFLWKIELIPASFVAFVPRFVKFLFIPQVMLSLIALIVVTEVVFFSMGYNISSISIGQIDIFVIAGILSLFICSSIVHEFGHATASSFCGAEPRSIGFGLYANFPVFYTDVSEVWKLPRKQRILVNLGGIYFQLLFLLPLFAIFFITHNDVLKYFIFTVNLNFLFTLNPFFKFDGYWVMADLLGVPNLRKRSNEVFKYYWAVIRRKPAPCDQKPFLFSLNQLIRLAFIVYSVIVVLFFIYYFCYIIPRFMFQFVDQFPELIKTFTSMIANGDIPSWGLISGILGKLVMLALIAYMLFRTVAPFFKKISLRIRFKH